MTVETRWSGLTVTDWLDGPPPSGSRAAAADPTTHLSGC